MEAEEWQRGIGIIHHVNDIRWTRGGRRGVRSIVFQQILNQFIVHLARFGASLPVQTLANAVDYSARSVFKRFCGWVRTPTITHVMDDPNQCKPKKKTEKKKQSRSQNEAECAPVINLPLSSDTQ